VIRYDLGANKLQLYGRDGLVEFPGGPSKDFAKMYGDFAKALRTGGSELLGSIMDGLEAVRISRLGTNQAIAARRNAVASSVS
jgi:hypothetical protein